MIRIRDDEHAWEVIEEYRETHSLTKEEMSVRLGISRMHYNRMNLARSVTANRVGFILKISEAIEQKVIIDGVDDGSEL